MKYESAFSLAQAAYQLLLPHCTIIRIAGSLRRHEPDVKDIEIVCLPKTVTQNDLFGQISSTQRSAGFINAVAGLGQLTLGDVAEGRQCKIIMREGIAIDMFLPVAADYYRQLAIRTGSADYTRVVIASGWRKKGWCGVKDVGLRKISECYPQAGHWHCNSKNPELPPAWESEEDFFTWLGVEYISPHQRTITRATYQQLLNR